MAADLLICGCEAADERGTRTGPFDIRTHEGVIVEVCPSSHPASGREVDAVRIPGEGATVVPGLINMHDHLGIVHPGTWEEHALAGESRDECVKRMGENASKALRVGVTALRLAGERDGLDVALRASLSDQRGIAPRIWTAGQPLDYAGAGRSFVGAVECSSIDDYRAAAHQQIDRGVDFLKVMLSGGAADPRPGTIRVSTEAFDAVRGIARRAGGRIAVHTAATSHPVMDMLVDEGLDSLEHCYLMDGELLERCVDRSVLLVLTPLVTRSPRYLEELGLPRDVIQRMSRIGETHWRTICTAVRSGARIALGTDFHSHVTLEGAPAAVRELELYEEAGAGPEMLLAIASRNGASWLGEGRRLGLVEEGFDADLLLLEENPFRVGAAAFRRLRHVISQGVLVKPHTGEPAAAP